MASSSAAPVVIRREHADLVTLQKVMRDWAETRRTPFGTVIPKYALPVFAKGAVQVPVYGTQVVVATYKSRANWISVISGLVLQTAGAGPPPNPNDVSFSVDIDRDLNSVAGFTVKDYNNVPFTLGNFTTGPYWPCEIKPKNDQTVRIKATAIANMGTGFGNFFTCALLGWEWTEQGFEGASGS
jgi:hypothetical protein